MGWIPDLPDTRDYTFRHPEVLSLLRRLKQLQQEPVPDFVDLRQDSEGEYFTTPEDQGSLNSSSAFAVLSLLEYFERRIHGRTYEGSKLFLHKVVRNLIAKEVGAIGDIGADLRTTFKVLTKIGVPAEDYWPYDVERFDEEPSAFYYAIAKPLRDLKYFRLDEPNSTGEATWANVRSFLNAGFPVVFGIPVPRSLTTDANIPFRPEFDALRGAQAVVAVGYSSNHFGKRQDALLIRCSWGSQWGDNGNGWLPVSYIRNQIARDFWTIASDDWAPSSELSVPSVVSLIKTASGRRREQ
jgi:C1A family cysteine protease